METIKIHKRLFCLLLASYGFGMDLDLPKAVQIAKEKNFSLQAVRSQAQSAEVQSSLARTSLGPTLGTGADISQSNRLDERGAATRWGADVTLSQSLDASKFTAANSKIYSARAAKMQESSSEFNITGNVLQAYLQFLRDSLFIRVYEQDQRNQAEKLKSVMAEVEAGSKSNSEVLQQEAVVAQTETNLLQRIRSAQNSKSDLVTLLGTEISSDTVRILFPSRLIEQTPEPFPSENLHDSAVKVSPAIESQNLRITAAKESIRSTKQQSLPTLTFSASLNHEDPLWSDPQGNTESSQYVRLQARLQLKILDGGARNAQLQQDQLSMEDAQRTKLQMQYEESAAIRKAFRQLETSQAMKLSAQKSLAASQKAAESIRAQYELGGVSLLEMRQAEQQALNAEANLIDAQMEYLISYVNLRYAQSRIDQVLQEFSREIQP